MVKVKLEQDVKPYKRASIEDLPEGANENKAWTNILLPTFLTLVLSSDNAWLYEEVDIKPVLQEAWNYTYGSRIPFIIEKNTVPYELVSRLLIIQTLTYICLGCPEVMPVSKQPRVQGYHGCVGVLPRQERGHQSGTRQGRDREVGGKYEEYPRFPIQRNGNGKESERDVGYLDKRLIIASISQSKKGGWSIHSFYRPFLPTFRHSQSARRHHLQASLSENFTAALRSQLRQYENYYITTKCY